MKKRELKIHFRGHPFDVFIFGLFVVGAAFSYAGNSEGSLSVFAFLIFLLLVSLFHVELK